MGTSRQRGMLTATLVALLLTGGLAVRDAHGNGAALPGTIRPSLIPDNDTALGIEANFGYLEAPDGQHWDWLCHEVFVPSSAQLTPVFFRNQAGQWLVTVKSLQIANNPNISVYWSNDGCTWNTASGINNVIITDIAFDPGNPSHVFAVSASSTEGGGLNGLWISNDAGHTWTAGALQLPNQFFRKVRFAPRNPQTIYATSSFFSPDSATFYSSTNGGTSFNAIPWTFSVDSSLQNNIDVYAISPTDSNIVYVRANGGLADYLLRTTNAGAAFSLVHTSPNDAITSAIYSTGGNQVWADSQNFGTFVSTNGVSFLPITAPSPVPHISGLAADGRGIWATANNYSDGFALGLTTNNGASFRHNFIFSQLTGPKACTATCPAGSTTCFDAATICPPLWPAVCTSLNIPGCVASPTPTPTGSGSSGSSSGCKCDVLAARGGALPDVVATTLLGVTALAFWRRARKRAG